MEGGLSLIDLQSVNNEQAATAYILPATSSGPLDVSSLGISTSWTQISTSEPWNLDWGKLQSLAMSYSLCWVFRIARGLSRYSPMSEVCAPRCLTGLVSTHG